MKEKAKKILIDGAAMIVCVLAADLVSSQIKFLSEAQSLLSVMAGVWLYAPVKAKIAKKL